MIPEIFKGTYFHLIPSFPGFVVFMALTMVSFLHRGKRDINLLFAVLCFMAGLNSLREILARITNRSNISLFIDCLLCCVFVFSLPVHIRFIASFLKVKDYRLPKQAAVAIYVEDYSEIVALNRDLERRIEESAADLERALEETDRTHNLLISSEGLAAIGQLVACTAHEMNNPISSASSLIQMSIENISRDKNPNHAEVLDDLQFSLKELKRTRAIIDSLLSLTRYSGNYTELVDIHNVIDDALCVLNNQYKHPCIRFNKEYALDVPQMEGNFANLGQLFINLISNAIQALEGSPGVITISTGFNCQTEKVTIQLRNDGIGIPEELMKDIFKPFFTTKPVGQGTGLGLYIVHEIVKKHDGKIHISSNYPGGGTLVTIELPRSRNPSSSEKSVILCMSALEGEK